MSVKKNTEDSTFWPTGAEHATSGGLSTGHSTQLLPFWKSKSLEEMNKSEWEALCDGCGRCCLNKLEDWDTGEIAWTNIACRLLDDETCQCKDYENRKELVADCVALTPGNVRELQWLPVTCAYRLIAEKRDLYWWHYLVSGDRQTVHEAGISVRGLTVGEEGIDLEEYPNFLVDWPTEIPEG